MPDYKFDFSWWSVEDMIAWDEMQSLKGRIPAIARSTVAMPGFERTPETTNEDVEKLIRALPMATWAQMRKEFEKAYVAIFQ